MRMARPDVIVDLRKLGELSYLREEGDLLAIGAMTTKRTVEESTVAQQRQPLLVAATRQIGHLAIRSRGTVGGSMAQADPAAEYPCVAVALGMEMKILGPEGERSVPADEFFITFLTTELESSEILTEIRVPAMPANTGWSFQEIQRRHGDFALVGIATTLTLDGGVIGGANAVLFGVGPTPTRLSAVESAVLGQAPSDALFAQAAKRCAEAIEDPIEDVHASGDYRRHLAGVLTKRSLIEAATRV
jgi:CO/xanthine dehydrogenase FAD-binding subunit